MLTSRLLGTKTQNTALLIFLGMALMGTGFTVVAFFTGLGIVNLIGWTVLSLICVLIFRNELSAVLSSCYQKARQLPVYLKAAIVILIIGSLVKSAQSPFTIDNESYYVQSIKWFNEYGIVKGMANLHIFFAQNSVWHILQAGVNFSFLTNRINDINGFIFVATGIYFIIESHSRNTGADKYWLSFMPLFWLLLFQFISSPSPDLPCLMLVPVIVHLYLKGDTTDIKIAFFLFLFLAVIKLTILPVGLVFIAFLRQHKILVYMSCIALPVLFVWVVKNVLTSGYPLYPLPFSVGCDWAIPKELFDFMIRINANNAYYDFSRVPAEDTWATRLHCWLLMEGLTGIINKLTLLTLAVMPFTKLVRIQKKYRLVYIALLTNFLALLFTSPQFRYFLHVPMCACLIIGADIYDRIKPRERIYKSFIVVCCASVALLFFNLGLAAFTTNKHHQFTGGFALRQLYLPERNTKYPDVTFVKLTTGNLEFYSPKENFFFYGTADGPLPCVNASQVRYFNKKMGIMPQLRGKELKNGFRSEKKP